VIALLYRELRTFHPRASDRKGGTS
jgi:hypothetical protein